MPSVVQARTRQLTNQSAKTESDDEPIEWGDMDPAHREHLQHNPEALQAFKLRRKQHKLPKLDTASNSFLTPTPSESSAPAVSHNLNPNFAATADNIKEFLEQYHTHHVLPAMNQMQQQNSQALDARFKSADRRLTIEHFNNLAGSADLHMRTVLIHNIPPFATKKSIDSNLRYLLSSAEMGSSHVQSVTNHLLSTTQGFLKVIFLADDNAKLFFQRFRTGKRYFRVDDSSSGDYHIKIERDLSFKERLERQPLHAVIFFWNRRLSTTSAAQ